MIGTWYRDSHFNWMCYSLYILNPIGHATCIDLLVWLSMLCTNSDSYLFARDFWKDRYMCSDVLLSREKQTECSFIRRSYLFLSTVAEKSFYKNTFAKIVSSHISSLTSFFSCNAIIMINLIRKLKAKLFTIYVLLYNCSPLKDPYLCFFA